MSAAQVLPSTPPSIDLPELFTVTDVALHFKASENWVRDHAAGKAHPILKGFKLGCGKSPWRFTREAIIEFTLALSRIGSQQYTRRH